MRHVEKSDPCEVKGRRGGVGDGDGGGRGVGETTAATGGPHVSLWGGGDGC